MRTKFLIATVLAAVFAAAGVTFASADSHSAGDDGAQSIELFAVTDQFAFIDADGSGETAPTVGDQFVFSDNLFDHKGGTKVGTDGVSCTFVHVAPAATPTEGTLQCVATVSLAGGQITIQGIFTTPLAENELPPPFELAVTGGTGEYEGAEGHVTVEELNDTDANLTVVLED
jgi:hypothetical protein